MNKEDEDNLLKWLKDKDVSEVMDLLMRHGNRYSRRILKFFRWFCKYVPITLMCFHAYGIYEFSQHPREMFIPYAENATCYLYIYFMVYVLPMVLILASRFFFLCWRYRIPFFYFASINAAHIVEWSWYTTKDMVDSCFTVMVVTAIFYLYSFTSNPQPIGFRGILLVKDKNSFYCTYSLHNRNVVNTKSPYPIKRLEVIRWFNQKSMVFNQSLS